MPSNSAEPNVEAAIRNYRRRRNHRRAVRSGTFLGQLQRKELNEFIDFAEKWAPYGGPPDDETFVTFGMTPARFRQRLHELIIEARQDTPLDTALNHPLEHRKTA
ncbi:hypothetical protein ACFVKB_40055 [Rhodococcus sp. NPDC127530]|uniref:hypothetical protein n=1 Tax=unclassified Rhodococcus (in: high G+C Gram-positive bacteria) TaxID=192944 RepID=UPI0036342891